MRLTIDSKWKGVLVVSAALSLAACSLGQLRETGSRSSPTGNGGTGGGACKNVAICTLIPQSQVNTSLGVVFRQRVEGVQLNSIVDLNRAAVG